MRKRTIIMGIAAFELATIPFAALLGAKSFAHDRVNVIAAEIDSPPGVRQFFVNSDGAFNVVAHDLQGQVLISATTEGEIGQARYGGNSQLPGPARVCALAKGPETQIIYQAHQGTIRSDGDVVSQAVLITILHDDKTEPEIQFVEADNSRDIPEAKTCRLAKKAIAPH